MNRLAFSPFRDNVINTTIAPLVHAFASGKAVLYVGAGASIPAGLPSWEDFLKRCLERAAVEPGTDPDKWSFARKLLYEQRDFLAAAELLQLGLGSRLEQHIWDTFGHAFRPSPIHYALSRLPASIAITINYDRLLESAYQERPRVWTWRDPEAFFSAIRNRRFAIIKTHGDVGNAPSLVLCRTQYRDLMHRNDAFNACVRTLLSHRTFLFVGTSLRDPDLMHLMDKAQLLLGPEFGPHYAILFENECDDLFHTFLRDSYNIHVITPRLIDQPHTGQSQWTPERMCHAVVRTLTEIGGSAAHLQSLTLPSPALDDPIFSRRTACEQLIERAVRLTGSLRGDICLVDSEDHIRTIRRVAEYPGEGDFPCISAAAVEHKPRQPAELMPIPYNSVIGGLFLRQKQSDDYIYLRNVKSPVCADALSEQGFTDIEYVVCHPDVRSELAVPIFSDGRRVGVLNVESQLEDAYTYDHLEVLNRLAASAGWIYYEARQRQSAARLFQSYFDDPREFRRIMYIGRSISRRRMEFILWRVDYDEGRMTAHASKEGRSNTPSPFVYPFAENSLATRVLRDRTRIIVSDAEMDINSADDSSTLSKKGVEEWRISGPVCGIPVQRDGNTCAILVGWSDVFKDATVESRTRFQNEMPNLCERISRLAQLLANQTHNHGDSVAGDGQRFIAIVDSALRTEDQGSDAWWDDARMLTRDTRCRLALALCRCLLDGCCRLTRVRLWVRDCINPKAFVCTVFETTLDARTDLAAIWDAKSGWKLRSDAGDPYACYTKARFANDPYSRHQHMSMFGGLPDRNVPALHKDPRGTWIVAPIVRRSFRVSDDRTSFEEQKEPRLLGFVSADCHVPVPISQCELREDDIFVRDAKGADCIMRERVTSSELQAFQRAAMDVITDVLAWVVDPQFASGSLRMLSTARGRRRTGFSSGVREELRKEQLRTSKRKR